MGECIIYTRVNSQEQAEGYSIDAQLNLLRDYAKEKDLTIVREFQDKETAKRGSARKGFCSMLDFIQGKGVRTVLCEKVDRFSRNFKDAQVIEDSGIEVHFVKEGEVISSQLSRKNSSRSKGKWFVFRGLLTCGYCGSLITAETKKGRYTYYHCTKGKECKQIWLREEEIEAKFVKALDRFSLNNEVRTWAKRALLESHSEEESFIKNNLKRLRAEQTKNETKLHQLYNDKVECVIDQEFFESEFRLTKQRQAEIKREMERFEAKNHNYMEEGLRILELMQSIKNVYLKADIEDKAKILRLLLQNCTQKGVSVRFYWNSPFDLLVKIGQRHERGERGVSNPLF